MKITITTNLPEEKTWVVPVTTIDPLDSLEEALYILWELCPGCRLWKSELTKIGVSDFKYLEEIAIVRCIGDMAYEVDF